MMAYAALVPFSVLPRSSCRRPKTVLLMREAGHFDLVLRRIAETRDRAAFQELFEHFAPRVKAYAMKLGAPAQTAEDLAQEAMLTVWRKAGLFDPARAAKDRCADCGRW
jgi:hypothetical protein